MGTSTICGQCNQEKINRKKAIYKDEIQTGHKSIPLDISNKVRESICKIIIKKKGDKGILYGSGFFMKISESLKFLFTNYHVINQDLINDNIEIEIWNKEKMNINLNQRNIKYFEKPKDVTMVEIKEEDKIYKDIKFLDYDSYYKEKGYNIYKDVDIFTLEHPSGDDVSCASGKILNFDNIEFTHNISTETGSSGCPIILLNNNINLILVIGIHKGSDINKKINYGIFIGEIINEFKNDSNFFPKIKKNKDEKEEKEEKEERRSDNKEINRFNDSENKGNVIASIEKKEIISEDKDNDIINEKNTNIMKKDNVIIAKIYVKSEEVKKFIRIINSYEDYVGYYGKNFPKRYSYNEKEIKECEIRINNELIKFNYFYAFKNEGNYTIKYTFKNILSNTNHLFSECSSLIDIDLSNFKTQNVKDMGYMFFGCSSLKNIDLSNLNTQNVNYMDHMFDRCSSLITLDLSNFNAQNIKDMDYIFNECSSLIMIDLSNFNAQKIYNMDYMFNECSSLKYIDLSNFNAQNIYKMSGIFSKLSSIENINLSNFNAPKVNDMNKMFNECPTLISIDLSNFNTQNVENMGSLFNGCSSLKDIDLSNFNTQKVTNMDSMFKGCSSLITIDLSNFNTQNVSYMGFMFNECSSLINIDLSNFNTQKVIEMNSMFNGCSSLKDIDLSNFNTQNVINMNSMFHNCSSLENIDLSNLNTRIVKSWGSKFSGCESMFSGCSSLVGVNLYNYNPKFSKNHDKIKEELSQMFNGCSALNGNILIKDYTIRNILEEINK